MPTRPFAAHVCCSAMALTVTSFAIGKNGTPSDGPNTISVSGGAQRAAEGKRWSVRGRRRTCGGEYGARAAATAVPSSSLARGSSIEGSTLAASRPLPNPSLHPTFNSRLRRLLPAGELKR
jgi:hypothetical protein